MKRRSFFKLFAGLTVGALPGFRYSMSGNKRIAVAGGGIVGASIAYHLSVRGADVLLLEKKRPASGATGKSFAWLNAHFSKQPHHYHRLNRLGTLAYRHLERELGGALKVQWGGSLEWYADAAQAGRLRLQVKRHQEWGYPTRLISEEEFHKLEENIVSGPVMAAAYSEQEGSIDSVQATEVLLTKAQESGAQVEYPCEVTGLDIRWGHLRGLRTTKGDFEADVLVIACGVETPKIAAMGGIEVPLIHAPGLLAHSSPQPRLIGRVIVAPDAHMKQKLDGRFVASAGTAPPQDDVHEHLSAGPQDFQEQGIRDDHAERILRESGKYLSQIEKADVEQLTMGWRPLPRDGFPVVGFTDGRPDLYLAVTHSGVTLAPLLGRLAALEILDNVRVSLLEPYRASRFEEGGKSRPPH